MFGLKREEIEQLIIQHVRLGQASIRDEIKKQSLDFTTNVLHFEKVGKERDQVLMANVARLDKFIENGLKEREAEAAQRLLIAEDIGNARAHRKAVVEEMRHAQVHRNAMEKLCSEGNDIVERIAIALEKMVEFQELKIKAKEKKKKLRTR